MARYLLTRLVALLGIVVFVTVASFLLIHILPGDPAESILRFNCHTAERRHRNASSTA